MDRAVRGGRTSIAVVGALLTLAACGDSAPERAAPAPTTLPSVSADGVATTPPAPQSKSTLPDLTVDDVAGGTVRLSSLTPSPQPTLVWFWAPH